MPVLNRLWLPNGYVAVPMLGDTGSIRETLLGAVLGLTCFTGFARDGLRLLGVDMFPMW